MLSWSNLETSASGRKGGRANALERKEGALIRADGNRDGTAAACADYDIMREVFLPCLADMQMEETCAADVGAPEREGRMFRMPRDVASGYFWLYAERDFAISATDMLFPRDFREQCRHPRFVSVRYYLSGSCVESVTNRTVEAPYLEGHVLDTPHWDCLCRAGTPIRNVEIMLAPLFYRSKVEEAVALVVDKSRAMAGERASELASEDMHAIERVRRRLEQQLAAPVDADELARIACMGQTKLRRTFKQACGCTIVEYRQRLRCAKAAELLAAGDAPVAQVAAAVGYRPERLAELFARTHHTTPSAYRAAMH